MKNKLQFLSKMPYYNTSVSTDKTRLEIIALLNKYDVKDYQWTQLGDKESVKFIMETTIQNKEMKVAVQFEIPILKALKGNAHKVVTVPREQAYRIFYYSLKSLLEATAYGVFSSKDVFYSYILTQLPNGAYKPLKDIVEKELPRMLVAGDTLED